MSIVVKVDRYHDNEPAHFEVFERCKISNELKNNTVWEPWMHAIFEQFITKESIVVEGGCHIGTHTVKLAKLCKTVFAFEPMPASYALLQQNILLNHLDNVVLSTHGLSNQAGTAHYTWSLKDNIGGSGLSNNPMGQPDWAANPGINALPGGAPISVHLITVDSLHLEKVDFIKLDVEGYEQNVIEGARETIRRCKPVITLEDYASHNDEIDPQKTHAKFAGLIEWGYAMYHIRGPDYLFLPIP